MSSSKEAILRWTGQGDAFVGSAGSGPEVTIDGSATAGTSPMDSVLLGLMACMAIDVLMILEKGRVPVDSMVIRAEADRAPEPPRYYTRIRLTYVLDGPSADQRTKIDRAIRLSREKYCSVLHSLRQDLELEILVEGV